jgi:hypothetical protein
MAFVKMKPPVGVNTGLGPVTDRIYTVDAQGYSYVDSSDVSGFSALGWVSVTDLPADSPDNIVRFSKGVTGVIGISAGGSDISGALGLGKIPGSYTICGSSISAFATTPQYPTVTIANNGNGTARCSGTLIARLYRTGLAVRVAGSATQVFNQFYAKVVAHDRTAAMAWFDYDITGPGCPVLSTGITVDSMYSKRPISSTSWPWWFEFYTGFSAKCLGNFGMGGGDTEQNVAMFDQTHAVANPVYVIGDASTNDVYARGWGYARIIAAHTAMLQKCNGIGAKYVLLSIPPRNTGYSLALMKTHLAVNEWIRSQFVALGGIAIDTPKATGNGLTFANTSSTQMTANANFLMDAIHFDTTAGRGTGLQVFNAVGSQIPKKAPVLFSCASEALSDDNLWANTALTATTGGTLNSVTNANVPDGVAVVYGGAGAAVPTLTARTVAADGDAFGNWFNCAASGSANNDQVIIQMPITSPALDLDNLVAALRLKTGAMVNVKGLTAKLRILYLGEDALYSVDQFFFPEWNSSNNFVHNDAIPTSIITTDWNTRKTANSASAVQSAYLEIVITFAGAGSVTVSIAHPTTAKIQ